MREIWVVATHSEVPREDAPKRRIAPGDPAMKVRESAYYLRRIGDGELCQVEAPPAAPISPAPAPAGTATEKGGK